MTEFSEIYTEYGKPVYRFLLSLTGDASLAEELLQETFCLALIHIDKFEGRSSLYTWLCRIGANAWSKECRRKKRYADTSWEELSIKDSSPSPEEQMIQKDLLHRIHLSLLKLENPYKEVFILHVFGELKLKEIAELNRKSESWARVTYYRARTIIAKEVS